MLRGNETIHELVICTHVFNCYTEHVFCISTEFLIAPISKSRITFCYSNLIQIRHEKEVIRQNRYAALTRVMNS